MPNYSLCLEKLQPLGIKVYNYVGDENFLEIQDNTFDIVIFILFTPTIVRTP